VRDAMDALGSSRRARPEADGKAVWSRHPDAGVETCGRQSRETTEANKPGLRGERGAAVKTIAQGRPGCFRLSLWFLPRAYLSHVGHGCQSALGLPCALSIDEDANCSRARADPVAGSRRHGRDQAAMRGRLFDKVDQDIGERGSSESWGAQTPGFAKRLRRARFALRATARRRHAEPEGRSVVPRSGTEFFAIHLIYISFFVTSFWVYPPVYPADFEAAAQ